MKVLKYCEDCQNVTQRHEVNKCCWKNGADFVVDALNTVLPQTFIS